jgi:protein TonB
MFEQSILLDGCSGKRIGALFASASAQIAGVGVLILIPLIYTQVLPVARFPLALPTPVSQPPQEPMKNLKPTHQISRSRILSVPFRIPALSTRASTIPAQTPLDSAAPQLSGAAAVPLPEVALPVLRIERPPEPPGNPSAEPVKPPPAGPLRVSGTVQAAKILRKVVPQYPPLARQARVSGVVRLTGVIAKDGTVQRLEVISGHPLLQKAALDAVSQWLYQPTTLSGEPVEVLAPIDVIFTLSQ